MLFYQIDRTSGSLFLSTSKMLLIFFHFSSNIRNNGLIEYPTFCHPGADQRGGCTIKIKITHPNPRSRLIPHFLSFFFLQHTQILLLQCWIIRPASRRNLERLAEHIERDMVPV